MLAQVKAKMLSSFLRHSVHLITVALFKTFDNDMIWFVAA